jgi:formamidopyrimidine-DNA glycosylase
LLDQTVVAGLGNIYVDEALHRAAIHPATIGLTFAEASRLTTAIKTLLRRAITKRGTSFSLHRDGLVPPGDFYAELRVFDQTGRPCTTCKTPIVKIRLGGRGTHLCPRCQRGR